MNFIQTCTVVAICIYAFLMALMGCLSYNKSKNLDGFLLGNRKIGPWVSAFSYGTAYFSAVVFIGYAGQHGWNTGVGAVWIGVGNAVLGCLISWLLFANRARKMTRVLGTKTMPEYFEKRYNSTGLKILSSVIIFIFLVPYSAAVYKGLGSLFGAIFPGVEVWVWMLLIAVLVAIYLVLGGYVATTYTDFIQGTIMIVGVIAMIIAIFSSSKVGGFGEFMTRLSRIPNNGDGVTGAQLTNIFGGKAFSALCFNIMLTSFGTWGLPQMVSKFYAIKSGSSVKQATVISTAFCAIIGCGAYLIGSASRLVLGNTLPTGGVDSVIPTVLLETLGSGKLTTVLLAVVVVLLLAASMSTLEAVVLASASAVAVDFIPTIKRGIKPDTQVGLTRLFCLIFVACSFIFATQNIPIIVNLMSFSWGVVSGCFIGPFVWGLFSKKITKAGVYAGMLSGLLTVGVSTLIISLTSGFSTAAANSPQMGVAAMAVSMIVVPVVSLFTKKLDSEHVEKCFSKPIE